MLKQLCIHNIAIIEHLTLDVASGLTVITGESGSGKSILLDAILLALGAKVSPKEVLRAGAVRGQVELIFDLAAVPDATAVRALLADENIVLEPDETELWLSRELTASGSRSRVNGVPVSRDVLAALRPLLMDLHGQHELTNLFQKDKQRKYLDGLGGLPVHEARQQVARAYEAWMGVKRRWDEWRHNRQQWAQQRDFMQFQWQELDAAALTTPDEDEQVKQALTVLAHADKLIQAAMQAGALLSEEGQGGGTLSVLDQLARVGRCLSVGAPHDAGLRALSERFDGLTVELQELASELRQYGQHIETDPARLAELTDRLDQLEKIKRKYGPTLADALAEQARLSHALSALNEDGEQEARLQAELLAGEAELAACCQKLSDLRRAVAHDLKQRLMAELQSLAMPGVSFDVALTPTAYGREGADEVVFLFSANPGEPLRPLAKVASGGELSRFLLAMKVLTSQQDGVPTLVFDEIDSGISGPTVKAVAEKLARLSTRLQVLTITHQPLLAALGRQHIHVEKQIQSNAAGEETVAVQVTALSADQAEHGSRRLKILSRLVSGMDTSDDTVEKFVTRLQEEAARFYQDALTQEQVRPGQPWLSVPRS